MPPSLPVWCREDLQRIYRNAVQYNTPGHGQHGGPCALLAGLLAGLLALLFCSFVCLPGACLLCMFACLCPLLLAPSPCSHLCLHHPPSMGIHVLHHPFTDFIEVAKSMLDFSEQLIAQHWAEIQAAEVRAAAELWYDMLCCAVLCYVALWLYSAGFSSKAAEVRGSACATTAHAVGIQLQPPCCRHQAARMHKLLSRLAPATRTPPHPWFPPLLQAQAQQPVAPQHDILAMFHQQHQQQQHPQAPPGFPPQ